MRTTLTIRDELFEEVRRRAFEQRCPTPNSTYPQSMTGLLFDTHVLFWASASPERPGPLISQQHMPRRYLSCRCCTVIPSTGF